MSDIPPAANSGQRRSSPPVSLPAPVVTGIEGVRSMTGLGRTSVREMIAAGTLRSIRIGGRRLVFIDSVLELLNRSAAD